MPFSTLANNQCVSYTNLQDAVNNGYLTLVSAITSTGQQSTKSYASAHVGGFNANYPPFANKQSNQLIVKGDVYNPGDFILEPSNGMNITNITGTVGGIPAFSYPAVGSQTKQYNGNFPQQIVVVYLNGTLTVNPSKITIYVDNVAISSTSITASGSQSKGLNFSVTGGANAPSVVKIKIESGSTPPPSPTADLTVPMSTLAVSKNTGQYQIAASGTYPTSSSGTLFISNDYGATWATWINKLVGYWRKVAVSGDGKYMLAVESYGTAYSSSNYGASWANTGLSTTQAYTGCAISGTGQYQTIIGTDPSNSTTYLKRSTDYGATWTASVTIDTSATSRFFTSIGMSSSGQYQTITTTYDARNISNCVYRSTDYGANWSVVSSSGGIPGLLNMGDISVSPDGTNQILCAYYPLSDGYFGGTSPCYVALKSENYGSTWSLISRSTNAAYVRSGVNDTTVNYLLLNSNSTTYYVQKTTSFGNPTDLTSSGLRIFKAIDMSNDGTYILAGSTTGLIRSTNSGTSFAAL